MLADKNRSSLATKIASLHGTKVMVFRAEGHIEVCFISALVCLLANMVSDVHKSDA
jgi:hypothetical protein